MRCIFATTLFALALYPTTLCLGADPFIAEIARFDVIGGPNSHLTFDSTGPPVRVQDARGELSDPLTGTLPVRTPRGGQQQPSFSLRIPAGTQLPSIGTSSMIPVGIENLSIQTLAPADVSFGGSFRGGWGEDWQTGGIRTAGTLTVNRQSDIGGTFDLTLNVSPRIRLNGTNSAGEPVSQEVVLPPDVLSLEGGPQPWSTVSPIPNSRGNFFLGVDGRGNRTPFTLRGSLASIEIAAAPFAIPEPAAVALLLICAGAGVAAFWHRRPRSRSTQ